MCLDWKYQISVSQQGLTILQHCSSSIVRGTLVVLYSSLKDVRLMILWKQKISHPLEERGLVQELSIFECFKGKSSYYFATKICGYVLIGCVYNVVFLKNAFFKDSLNHCLSHIHKYPRFLCIICTFALFQTYSHSKFISHGTSRKQSHISLTFFSELVFH